MTVSSVGCRCEGGSSRGSGGSRCHCGMSLSALGPVLMDLVCDSDRAIEGAGDGEQEGDGEGGAVLTCKEVGDIGADLMAIWDNPREWDMPWGFGVDIGIVEAVGEGEEV